MPVDPQRSRELCEELAERLTWDGLDEVQAIVVISGDCYSDLMNLSRTREDIVQLLGLGDS